MNYCQFKGSLPYPLTREPPPRGGQKERAVKFFPSPPIHGLFI